MANAIGEIHPRRIVAFLMSAGSKYKPKRSLSRRTNLTIVHRIWESARFWRKTGKHLNETSIAHNLQDKQLQTFKAFIIIVAPNCESKMSPRRCAKSSRLLSNQAHSASGAQHRADLRPIISTGPNGAIHKSTRIGGKTRPRIR